MRYVVKFSIDLYIQDQLTIPSYDYRYSDPFRTISDALHYQETIRERFMRHEAFGIMECDDDGNAVKYLQYGAWSTIFQCSEKRAMEIMRLKFDVSDCY